jgi:sulfatase modifying factor 1
MKTELRHFLRMTFLLLIGSHAVTAQQSIDRESITVPAKTVWDIQWIYVEGAPGGDFYLSATEVTFDQFDAYCSETKKKKPIAEFGRGNHPVINVNVSDAAGYCEWLSKKTGQKIRLPEEKEWEFAAKGGNKSKGFIYSGSNIIDEVAWYSSNSSEATHEVGTKGPNELGFHDMTGNVWEWCGTSGIIRGGSWRYEGNPCKIKDRYTNYPLGRGNNFGFRILREK